MTELFIPRQGRNLPPRPLQGLPRLRPGESVRHVSARSSAPRQGAAAATGPVAVASSGDLAPAGPGELPAGPGTPRVRRSGPRHGRRRVAGPGLAPVLAGAAGLVLGLCLGTAGWAVHAQRSPELTEREIAVALREARLAQSEPAPAFPGAAPRSVVGSR